MAEASEGGLKLCVRFERATCFFWREIESVHPGRYVERKLSGQTGMCIEILLRADRPYNTVFKMFSDHTSDVTEFASSWRQTRSVREGSNQTDELRVAEAEAQARTYADAAMQTDNSETGNTNDNQTPHLPSLVKFLSHATPLIEFELAAAARSRAFDGYALIEDDEERQARKLHTLVDVTSVPGGAGLKGRTSIPP